VAFISCVRRSFDRNRELPLWNLLGSYEGYEAPPKVEIIGKHYRNYRKGEAPIKSGCHLFARTQFSAAQRSLIICNIVSVVC
jgi:hypothetical protein